MGKLAAVWLTLLGENEWGVLGLIKVRLVMRKMNKQALLVLRELGDHVSGQILVC